MPKIQRCVFARQRWKPEECSCLRTASKRTRSCFSAVNVCWMLGAFLCLHPLLACRTKNTNNANEAMKSALSADRQRQEGIDVQPRTLEDLLANEPEAAAFDDEYLKIPTGSWMSPDEDNLIHVRILDLGNKGEQQPQTGGMVFITEISGSFQVGRSNKNGIVTFKDVRPGIHTITYIATNRFMVSTVHIAEVLDREPRLFPSNKDFWCVNYGKREIEAITLPYMGKVAQGAVPSIDKEKAKLIGQIRKDQQAMNVPLQDAQSTPLVRRTNGGLEGTAYHPGTSNDSERILEPLVNADVLLVSDEGLYDTTQTDETGFFRFDLVEPRLYGLVCASKAGITSIGLFVMPEDQGAQRNGNFHYQLVSQLADAGSLSLQVSPTVPYVSFPFPISGDDPGNPSFPAPPNFSVSPSSSSSPSNQSSSNSSIPNSPYLEAASTPELEPKVSSPESALSAATDETAVPFSLTDSAEPDLESDPASTAVPP